MCWWSGDKMYERMCRWKWGLVFLVVMDIRPSVWWWIYRGLIKCTHHKPCLTMSTHQAHLISFVVHGRLPPSVQHPGVGLSHQVTSQGRWDSWISAFSLHSSPLYKPPSFIAICSKAPLILTPLFALARQSTDQVPTLPHPLGRLSQGRDPDMPLGKMQYKPLKNPFLFVLGWPLPVSRQPPISSNRPASTAGT